MTDLATPTAPAVAPPAAPRLFLVDGYALIYRAFFALISRPLRTSRGENTSAAWGVVNFLNRLVATHRPEYLAWVNDSGMSFRHEQYPAYKATREKLTEELSDDFATGMERIRALLEAFRVPQLSVAGYEADDVIGALAERGAGAGLNVVIVSGDKDFHQLVRPGVWLLNPGRGGPAAIDEQWVGVENGSDRLGVPPERTVDYLALVGDASDNVPGVKGIGDKGRRRSSPSSGRWRRSSPTSRRSRPSARARRCSRTATTPCCRSSSSPSRPTSRCRSTSTRCGCASPTASGSSSSTWSSSSPRSRGRPPGRRGGRGRGGAAPALPDGGGDASFDFGANVEPRPKEAVRYETVDTVQALERLVARARKAAAGGGTVAVDTETVIEAGAPLKIDPLRSRLVSIAVALAPGEAYYLPLAHREHRPEQTELLAAGGAAAGDAGADPAGADVAATGVDPDKLPTDAPPDGDAPKKAKKKPAAPKVPEPTGIAGRMLAERSYPVRNLPPLDAPEMRPLVALLEDAAVSKTLQNAKYDILALRRAGVELAGSTSTRCSPATCSTRGAGRTGSTCWRSSSSTTR
jgi:DNA polymerase-1